MKVLIFMSQFYLLGGAERLAVELAEELNKIGIHTDILSMYTEDLPGVLDAKRCLLQKGIPAIRFLGMQPHPPVKSILPAIIKLRRLIREEKYDIIETSMLMPSVIASWASTGTSVKHLVGVHDVFTNNRYNSVKHKFWCFSLRHHQNCICYAISEYVKRHWVTYSKVASKRTKLIYNAIPNDCFETIHEKSVMRKELGLPLDAKIALFVGRLLKRKGIDTILEALGPVLHEENIYLIYVGDTDQVTEGFFTDEAELLKRMEDKIFFDGLSDRVIFLGRRSDVPYLMASSDVLVHPARIEGFGLVLAEAMASGLPVVASDVDGIPEVLAETDSIMVPADDPKALRMAVLETLNRTREETERAIRKGRKRAESFRIRKRVDCFVKLFRDFKIGLF